MGIAALDLVGLVRGWVFFDHAAHLSGVAVGVAYSEYGWRIAQTYQRKVVEYWLK